MNRIQIVPIALATALFVAGGASQAFASDQDHNSVVMPPVTASSSTQSTVNMNLSLAAAKKMALDKVGGGLVIRGFAYPADPHTYRFDIINGSKYSRVYVDARSGQLSLDTAIGPYSNPFHRNHAGSEG